MALLFALAGCEQPTPVMMWVEGFEPENIRFEIDDLGAVDDAVFAARAKAGDVDGALPVPAGSCGGPCRAVLVTAIITNRAATKEAPPVMRLASPAGRARRLPIAFGAASIDPGRVGRIRFLVQLWPEERDLTATLSSSVNFDVSTPSTTATPSTPSTPSTSAPRPSRAERRALRTEEILQTAEQLIAEGGLAALTTTELARRTDAALGALYRFFPSKQAVVAALQSQALAALHDELVEARRRALALPLPEPARQWAPFVAIADLWFAEPTTHPARFRLIDEILSTPEVVYADDDARRLEAGARAVLDVIKACVDDVVAVVGVPEDPALTRRFPLVLWGVLHGVSHFTKRDRIVDVDDRAARVAASSVVLLLQGLGARAVDVDVAFAAVPCRALVR